MVKHLPFAMIQATTPPTNRPPSQAPQIVEVGPGGQVIRLGGSSPNAIYEAFKAQRNVLGEQLHDLENQRENIVQELTQRPRNDVQVKGLEARLVAVDARIADMEKRIADADAQVATSAAVPGAVIPYRPPPRTGPPDEVFVLAGVFMFVVLLPLTIAYARRIWRRGAATVAAIPQDLYDRFNRVDQAIDSVAIEVERIGEGQRFLTRMYSEQQRALGAGPAERVETPERDKERLRRGT